MQIKQEVLAEPEQFIGQTRSLANNEFDLEGALTMISSLLLLNLASKICAGACCHGMASVDKKGAEYDPLGC